MSLLNATSELPNLPNRSRQAASLSATLGWYLERAWSAMEAMGQRRAAPELTKLAQRLAAQASLARPLSSSTTEDGRHEPALGRQELHQAAAQLLKTAKEWSAR